MSMKNSNLNKKFILIGAGGHASVLLDIMRIHRYNIYGLCASSINDDNKHKWGELNLIDNDSDVFNLDPNEFNLVNGVGVLPGNNTRVIIQNKIDKYKFSSPKLIHPFSFISDKVELSNNSVQIMAGSVVQTGTKIMDNVIVNTGATIDHDCLIGKNVAISPGARICGGVTLEDNVFIGAGAIIIQGITIKKNSIIGAGAVIIKNVPEGSKIIKYHEK